MASNSFGNIFKILTWGESHGKGVGVVIDGCPAGLKISDDDINVMLARRAPGRNVYTSPRKEADIAEIYSGVFDGVTTGAPINIVVHNKDVDSSKYEPIKHLMRPGHANFTYLKKYGVFDYKGGGRSSARETIGRVAAAAVANKILQLYGIEVVAHLSTVNVINVDTSEVDHDASRLKHAVQKSPIFVADANAELAIMKVIGDARERGDSLGGVVSFKIFNCPVGLGDPVYEKIEANLAHAMLSMPASKGFEIGFGFAVAGMCGSEHNDRYTVMNHITTETNNAGGILGGITTGQPIVGRVAFKPTSSIMLSQDTVDIDGNNATFDLPKGSRHDPCVAIRAVPVVEAMCILVIADAILMNKIARMDN